MLQSKNLLRNVWKSCLVLVKYLTKWATKDMNGRVSKQGLSFCAAKLSVL